MTKLKFHATQLKDKNQDTDDGYRAKILVAYTHNYILSPHHYVARAKLFDRDMHSNTKNGNTEKFTLDLVIVVFHCLHFCMKHTSEE